MNLLGVCTMPTFEKYALKLNPFEPAASGAPVGIDLWLPTRWSRQIRSVLDRFQGQGAKVLVLTGEYGSGKTYVLKWLEEVELPKKRKIKPFYFDNPGGHFYYLADSLLRKIGRKDFAKSLWELATNYIGGYQRSLFTSGFEEYLQRKQIKGQQDYTLNELQEAILKAGVTSDGEVAHRLARIVAGTPTKPYFDFRDFVAGKPDALVAEKEEAQYFGAILKTLRLSAGINAVAFLIDEFEEISYQKRLTKREAHDYLGTLKRLVNLTREEDLWVVISMTPDGLSKTIELDPALRERFSEGEFNFNVPPLTKEEATDLVRHRINQARTEDANGHNELYPFPDDFVDALKPTTYSSPRRLIKVCFYALSGAEKISLPFTGFAQK
jgi:type II secretory pathway predicted ATPase ExeA